jgi:hypothetical protein
LNKECKNDDKTDLSQFLIDPQIPFFFSFSLVYLVFDRIFCWNYKLHASTGRIDNNSIFFYVWPKRYANRNMAKEQDSFDKICIHLDFFSITHLSLSLSFDWAYKAICVSYMYVYVCSGFLFSPYCNITTNQINAFMRKRKKRKKRCSYSSHRHYRLLFFLFGVIYAIGLVDWLNMHFCPMINENDVIWLERKRKEEEKQLYLSLILFFCCM